MLNSISKSHALSELKRRQISHRFYFKRLAVFVCHFHHRHELLLWIIRHECCKFQQNSQHNFSWHVDAWKYWTHRPIHRVRCKNGVRIAVTSYWIRTLLCQPSVP